MLKKTLIIFFNLTLMAYSQDVNFKKDINLNGHEIKNLKDSSITKPKLSKAIYDYIDASGGGSIVNNPDDITLETKTGEQIGIKDSWIQNLETEMGEMISTRRRDSSGYVTPEQFGADGINDYNAFVSALATGKSVKGTSGVTYLVNSTITINDSVDISSTGNEPFYIRTYGGGNVFDIHGDTVNTTTLTANAIPNTNYFTGDWTGFTVGNLIEVKSNTNWQYSGYVKGELHKIQKITGTTLYVYDKVWNDFDVGTETITVREFKPVHVSMKNMVISVIDTSVNANEIAIRISNAEDVVLENIQTKQFQYGGVFFNQCYNLSIKNHKAFTSNKDGVGYGLWIGNSSFIRISDSYFNENSHGIDLSGTYPTRNTIITNSQFTGNGFSNNGGSLYDDVSVGVFTHISENTLITGNQFNNLSLAVGIRGANAVMSNNKLSGRINTGFELFGSDFSVVNNETSTNMSERDTTGNSLLNTQLFVSLNNPIYGTIDISGNKVEDVRQTFINSTSTDTLFNFYCTNNKVSFSSTNPAQTFRFVNSATTLIGYFFGNKTKNKTGNAYYYGVASPSRYFDFSDSTFYTNFIYPTFNQNLTAYGFIGDSIDTYITEFDISDSLGLVDEPMVKLGNVAGELYTQDTDNNEMILSNFLSGVGTFTATATTDTIVNTDIKTNDVFVVSINDASPVANDLLSWTNSKDTLFVHRPAGTTSGLKYSYMRLGNREIFSIFDIDSLYGYWNFGLGVTGDPVSSWADQSTLGLNNPLVQATGGSQPDLQADGIYFDGIDDGLSIAAADATDLIPYDQSFSIAFSFKSSTEPVGGVNLIYKRQTSALSNWLIGIINGTIYLSIKDASGNSTSTGTSGMDVVDGSWHKLVFVVDRSVDLIYKYVDGTLLSSTDCSSVGSIVTTAGANFGITGTIAYAISYLTFSKKALTQVEVSKLKNNLP